jgi:hypothetical protein
LRLRSPAPGSFGGSHDETRFPSITVSDHRPNHRAPSSTQSSFVRGQDELLKELKGNLPTWKKRLGSPGLSAFVRWVR